MSAEFLKHLCVSCVTRSVEVKKGFFFPRTEIVREFSVGRTVAVAATGLALVAGVYGYRRWRRPQRVLVDPMMVAPEGLVEGNPLMEGGRIPSCQVRVAVKSDNGDLVVLGGGVRILDCLVTATHNTLAGKDLYILTDKGTAKVDTSTEMVLAADLSAFKVSRPTWSNLGVSIAKLGPMGSAPTVSIVSSCDKRYSVGTLRCSRETMGRVGYYGSTQPGFSGCAYMNGTVCLGIHMHGGTQAGGYESLYVYHRLQMELEEPGESGSYLLEKADEDYQVESLGDDFALVRFSSGHYHRTTQDIVDLMKKKKGSKNWVDMMEYEELEQELANRDDYQPEGRLSLVTFPGESQRPRGKRPPPVVSTRESKDSTRAAEGTQRKPTERERLISQLSSISNAQLRAFLEASSSRTRSQPTASQTRAQQQN